MSTYDYEDKNSDEAFMEGFEDEMEVDECAECGSDLREETFQKTIDGDSLSFCTTDCAKDYKDTI